jgi:hypothetical protein
MEEVTRTKRPPLAVAPREAWAEIRALDGSVASLLENLVHESRSVVPDVHSLTLYGGIPLGEFSPDFSDVNLALFSDRPLAADATANALGLWSRLVRDYEDLARRLVITFLPLPWIGARNEDAPLGFQIRSRWEDGRVACRALWRSPFGELDLVSLTRHGLCLLGHSPRGFLPTPSLQSALVAHGRTEIEELFLRRGGRRHLMRTFRRAGRPGVGAGMSRIEEERYVSTVLGLTRLVQALREDRLVTRSASGIWFGGTHGGTVGRFARDVAVFRLNRGAFPRGFLSARARLFPLLARAVLEEVAPVLYDRPFRLIPAADPGNAMTEWDHLSRALAGSIEA